MKRRPIVGGNWKMNTVRTSAVALGGALAGEAARTGSGLDGVDIAVFPPFVYLEAVGATLKASGGGVLLGAQDCFPGPAGAFTGEIGLDQLLDLGVRIVLAGHSERRHVIREPEELIARKVRAILDANLMCILCVGETLAEREAGETDGVNERQVRSALAGLPPTHLARLVVAYEPVWAIGTGRNATPADAQNAHVQIRSVLAGLFGADAARGIRIQYGGSVNAGNAPELFAGPDVDGGLIGGASLKAEEFLAICRAAAQKAARSA